MIEGLTNDDVFDALDTKEIEAGCRFILEAKYPGGKDARANALKFAAELKRFRPEYLARRPLDKNLPLLVQATRHRGARRLRPDAVKAWLVGNHRSLLSAFLQACNIPEKEGFVDGADPLPPTRETLRHAMDKISESFEDRVVAIYLAFLLVNGGDFWVNLPAAVTPDDTASVSDSAGAAGTEAGVAPSPLVEEAESANAEDSTAFTTLDRVLIERAVAAANDDTGALSEEQLEDFIEEIVALNSHRQHSVFHRGFFHALFGRPAEFSFRGENASRRIWYFTGVLMGLLRGANKDRVLEILREQQELFGLLCDKGSPVAANMLLPQLIPALWDEGELTMAKKLAESHLDGLQPKAFTDLVVQLYYKCAALLRKGQWEQAGWFLDFIGDAVPQRADLPDGFHEWFRPHVDRKRAQVFQLKGDFQSAANLLQHVANDEEGREQGSALADLGLIRGKLRSLQSSLPSKDEGRVAALMSALAAGRADFEAACERYPKDATNAHFCLGLLELLHEKSAASAADHFREALSGMLAKKDAYTEGGVLQWNLFLLGVALLESSEPAEFEHARLLVEGALADEINYPLWLWNRAMQAAALFPDTSLGENIARHLLEHRGTEAYHSIWDSGLAAEISALRGPYVDWLARAPVPIAGKWRQLKLLLPAALKDSDCGQGENILDQMEYLAEQAEDVRSEFVELLGEHRNYSPAWEPPDAVHSLTKLYELDSNSSQGIGLLHKLFFQLHNEDNPSFATVGPQIVERMVELGADEAAIDDLRRRLPAPDATPDPASVEDSLREVAVCILYVGGNETQAGYEDNLRKKLARRLPNLDLKTIFPGWGSNWIVHLDHVRALLPSVDAVVLNRLVRTQFGRGVRRHCNSETPWWPCTGKGLKALQSSIEAAALWAASKKSAA
jgi:hypothetical protein